MRRAFLLCLAALALIALAAAHRGVLSPLNTGDRIMVLVNKQAHSITVYRRPNEIPVCSANVGVNPHEVAVSNDGRTAYVPVYGTTGVGQPGTDEHTLYFIRTSDCHQLGILDTGEHKRLHGIYVGMDDNIYLTAEIGQSVLIINPAQRQIVAVVPTGSSTSHMLAVLPDLSRAYVSDVQSKFVSVLDLPNRKLLQEVPTEVENQRMTLSPDQKWFVTNLGPAHKIAFFRTSDNQLDFEIPVEGEPFCARFNPDGKYLYDAGHNHGAAVAWKIDVAQRKPVGTLSVGVNVGALAVNPEGDRVYVSDQAKNWVTEISPDSWTIAKRLSTANGPDQMAFATVQ